MARGASKNNFFSPCHPPLTSQLPGTIRALPSSVRLPGGRTTQLLWGLPERTRQRETLMVGHSLRHQSAVDVRVVGVRVTEEEPYAATLTAVYGDGDRRSRSVLKDSYLLYWLYMAIYYIAFFPGKVQMSEF